MIQCWNGDIRKYNVTMIGQYEKKNHVIINIVLKRADENVAQKRL